VKLYNYISNKKGIVLLASYLVVMVVAILSTAFLTQVVTESKSAKRSTASVEAFYAAQAGLNFAYAECYLAGWDWRTHDWANGFVDTDVDVHATYPSNLNLSAAWDSDGYYTIPGYDFKVRAYRELDWDKVAQNDSDPYTGVIIIHSQGTDPDSLVTRTLELRVSQRSMYQYFYFFPESHTFESGTYDGGGYGGIHVNGNITFKSYPTFVNLTSLSAGDTYDHGNPDHTGYLNYYNFQYSAPYSFDDNDPGSADDRDGFAPMPISSAPPYNYYNLSEWFSTDYHFNYHKYAYGKINLDASTGSTFPIPKTLDSGSDYEWNYDKYKYSQPADEVGVRFKVDDSILAMMARNERGASASSRTANPSYYLLTDTEQTTFNADPANFDWSAWRNTHSGSISADNLAIEKKFWRARYNCQDTGNWAADADTASTDSFAASHYSINHEWWDDLTYGNDRASLTDDLSPAQSEITTSPEYEGYYLNTEHQVQSWQDYMENKEVTITKSDTGEEETLELSSVINDSNTGGEYINPMRLEVNYAERAEEGGISITTSINSAWTQWQQTRIDMIRRYFRGEITREEFIDMYLTWLQSNPAPARYVSNNPISDVTTVDNFYNTTRPARASEYTWQGNLFDKFPEYSWMPARTKVLTIDVAALNEKIENENLSFNGVVYVESADYSDTAYDYSVRLINAGVLPEAGLTVVSPHNIYVQGNFNLDNTIPDDGTSLDARDYQAIQDYMATHSSEGYSQDDFTWHPAALISTQRMVYTLSDSFNDPQQLPLSYDYWNRDTRDYYPYCLDDAEFLEDHVPAPSSSSLPQTVKTFFDNHPELTPPSSWSWDWINTNLDVDTYPEANDVRKSLLDAGNAAYQTGAEALMPNRVEKDTTYNTAIVSPYDPQAYILERWHDTNGAKKKRNIVGAFIQLEDVFRSSVPLSYQAANAQGVYVYKVTSGTDRWGRYNYAYYWHGNQPHNRSTYWPSYKYAYEVNFADRSGDSSDEQSSSADFLAGSIGSWREIRTAEF